MYEPRFYRDVMGHDRFTAFTAVYKESDLWIGVDKKSYNESMDDFVFSKLWNLRSILDNYINRHPGFVKSFFPVEAYLDAPGIIKKMTRAGKKANVGPMACVAGAVACEIGNMLINEYRPEELIVENGGDIFLKVKKTVEVSVFAGNSPLSGKVGVKIPAEHTPCGVCTSSGTIGHSTSFGAADAVMIISRDTLTADAFATALCNRVMTGDDIEKILDIADTKEDISGILVIKGDTMGIRGQYDLALFN